VISTSAGGISEYLRDGENGFLVPVGDKEKLLRAMERALNLSEVEYRQMGKRAMETAEGYSIERTAEGYVRLFNKLLG
ncbi:MAG TPA: glycosyltransferase, partial [Aquifex sp.]|nr:glycosyltransferase [Aquifex sp.]